MALLKKDFIAEYRSKETLTLNIALSILLAITVSLALQSSFLSTEYLLKAFPALQWLIFIFSATLAASRTLEYEVEDGALDGLRLSGANLYLVFASKLILLMVIFLVGNALSYLTLCTFLNLPIIGLLFQYLGIAFLVLAGFAPLSLLFSAMTMRARLKGLLMPLLLIPILFPLIFGAVELTTGLVLGEDLSGPWVALLIAFDLLYLVLSIYFFAETVKG